MTNKKEYVIFYIISKIFFKHEVFMNIILMVSGLMVNDMRDMGVDIIMPPGNQV